MTLFLAGMFLAGIGLVGWITNGSNTPSTPDMPEVSLTALMDASQGKELASVTIPTDPAMAVAVTSRKLTTGQLANELGGEVPAATAFTVRIPPTILESTIAQLTQQNVPVWMGTTANAAAAQAQAPADDVAAEQLAGSYGHLGAFITALVLGSILALWGLIRMMFDAQDARRRSDAASRAEAAAGSGDPVNRPAKVPQTRFTDVAGAREAVEQLQEMVDYLRNPVPYQAIGAKLPKGALMVGPPGTGKTLIARAVAGEAGVPFFAAAGSDFVEMFVGVGPKRIRELFAKAKQAGRAIIFIDEIDAVARKRSDNPGQAGNQESENTLIALLSEMDGFESSNIIVLAATNRPDILDPALTRPGRLDRRIEVPLPDRPGREHILGVHAAKVLLDADVDLAAVSRRTQGFSGAQLATVINEAALDAVRMGLTKVTPQCLNSAVAMVAMGKARTSAVVTDADRSITAWHEAGHTVAALMLADADEPVAVSIVPRGPAGGVTWMAGTDDQFLSRTKAHAKLVVALSGRTAEQILLGGEFTQGASSDLESATELALLMATRYGMTDLGLASRGAHMGGTTTKEVTQVVEQLLAQAHEESASLLTTHMALVEEVVAELLEHSDLDAAALAAIAERVGVTPASHAAALPPVPVPSSAARPDPAAVEPDRSAGMGPVVVYSPESVSEAPHGLLPRARAAARAAKDAFRQGSRSAA